MQTLLVNKSDPTDTALIHVDNDALTDGMVRVKIGPWALTANNITYMIAGENFGYWKFFDPKAYGISLENMGRMPVWGYGIVEESLCADVAVGTEIYGFFPVADSIDLKPTKLNPLGFQDGREHRLGLHSVYNSYSFTSADPSFGAHKDLQPVLRPLFTTSFLIDDFLQSNAFFGAEQVLLLSASSKTALGTGFCLKQGGRIKVAGLTSEKNKSFVKATGFYDEVQSYDTITDLNPDVKTVIVDMAGNGRVMANLYDHFEENIVYNMMVGKSHWTGESPPAPKLSAKPIMFFAPDHAKKRFEDWGAAGFAKNLAGRWLPFCEGAASWLNVSQSTGAGAVLKTYKALLEGSSDPAQASLFKL